MAKRWYREKEIEDYVFHNLNKIERGLKGISQQYRNVWKEKPYRFDPIDILAEDKNGCWVIIEVKVVARISGLGQLKLYMQNIEGCRGMLLAEIIHPALINIKESNIKILRVSY